MDFFDILTLIGGLAMFLFGMQVLGDGLTKASGGRMESILEKLTSNPFKGVFLGMLVTAVIQSSSATTVMVVGFVNAGIMKLSQAVGVIMGANIGTTVTSWILSLVGLEGSNFVLQMLKPQHFSPILAIIGIFMLMTAKKDKYKDMGNILVGFAVLMFGMNTMSDTVKPLADVPEFQEFLLMFENPFFGVFAGMLLTAIIQSSSASVGILQALCSTGAVSFAVAIPIIMGQNIGTCITALLSSIGTTKNARRAALVHLYFNLIGTLCFLILFYVLHAIINFGFMGLPANEMGIAIVHTCFNVFATALLLPFAKMLEKLACLTIKDNDEAPATEEEKTFAILDERFLEAPGLAVEQCRNAAADMAAKAKEALMLAQSLFDEYDENILKEVMTKEDLLDRYEDELGSYLVKLSSRNLSEKDSHMLSILLHCIGDLERIGDHAVNLAHSAKEMHDKNLRFSVSAEKELTVFVRAVNEILETAVNSFEEQNESIARTVEPLEEVIDQLNDEMKDRHIIRLRRGECTIEMGFILADVMNNYERVSDHCSNIAICAIQENVDVDAHDYIVNLKTPDNTEFLAAVDNYKKKYYLPR
ncbi:MAG: Na/Pi cotransporter family protein [Lachnospiraceae bacterium]|nr:Na/Pi cotransporter family protein [Lachnospiraceae bacterium]